MYILFFLFILFFQKNKLAACQATLNKIVSEESAYWKVKIS